jgi:hypothetical protein
MTADDPTREQWAASRLSLEVDIGERMAVRFADDESKPGQPLPFSGSALLQPSAKNRHAAQDGRIGGGCLFFHLCGGSRFQLRSKIAWRVA